MYGGRWGAGENAAAAIDGLEAAAAANKGGEMLLPPSSAAVSSTAVSPPLPTCAVLSLARCIFDRDAGRRPASMRMVRQALESFTAAPPSCDGPDGKAAVGIGGGGRAVSSAAATAHQVAAAAAAEPTRRARLHWWLGKAYERVDEGLDQRSTQACLEARGWVSDWVSGFASKTRRVLVPILPVGHAHDKRGSARCAVDLPICVNACHSRTDTQVSVALARPTFLSP